MMLKKPNSMDECVYFTSRTLYNGEITVWVLKETCPKCKKGIMGKPRDESGKVKIRAKEYVCPGCGYSVEKQAYEDTLTANAEYDCPKCRFKGEAAIPFKRKMVEGAQTLRFICEKCKAVMDVTKKFKEKKKKGQKDEGEDAEI